MITRPFYLLGAAVAVLGILAASLVGQGAGQATGPAPASAGKDYIEGTVSSTKGPEAGAWVIAETTDLPTRYIKAVVTDDRGRYLIPDLPKANYTIWARAYGLMDSPKVKTELGKVVDLKPTVAPDAKSASHYYPAMYWYSLVNVPKPDEFPGTGDRGNGILPARQEPGSVARGDEDRRLRGLPSTWQRVHADDSGHVQQYGSGAGVAAPLAVGTGRRANVWRHADASRPQGFQ